MRQSQASAAAAEPATATITTSCVRRPRATIAVLTGTSSTPMRPERMGLLARIRSQAGRDARPLRPGRRAAHALASTEHRHRRRERHDDTSARDHRRDQRRRQLRSAAHGRSRRRSAPAHRRSRSTGRAVLPVQTYAPGPPSGNLLPPGVVNGISFPLPSQPVQGFSSIIDGRAPGEYLAMPDNGFGAKANSTDFLIRAYYIHPDFKTAQGGSGAVSVGDYISFRDPHHRIGFPIVNEAHLRPTAHRRRHRSGVPATRPPTATCGSATSSARGSCTSRRTRRPARSRRSRSPACARRTTRSSTAQPATQPNSRGFEGMAITPDGKYLYAALEGAQRRRPGPEPPLRLRVQHRSTRR